MPPRHRHRDRTCLPDRRCLFLADGFDERKREGSRKQPYYIRFRDGEPFAFAGLWDRWQSPDGPPLETCTILTTTPNDLVQPIHDRMPVILPSSAYDRWLDPVIRDVQTVQALLTSYPAEEMVAYPVIGDARTFAVIGDARTFAVIGDARTFVTL